MSKFYTIDITNKTGGPQTYTIFSSPPIVSGANSGSVWGNVLLSRKDFPDGGVIQYKFWAHYQAVCGTFSEDEKSQSPVTINQSVPVDLGSETGTGVNKGSSVEFKVTEGGTVGSLGIPTSPGQGETGSFALVTTNEFTTQNAIDSKFLVGVASAIEEGYPVVMGVFAPEPGYTYQIAPSSIFHITTGSSLDVGAPVNVELLGKTVSIDFKDHQTDDSVKLIHNELFNFEILSPLPPPPKIPSWSPALSEEKKGNYSITIQNQTGVSQDYALYSEPPMVNPSPKNLTSRAILVAHGVVPGSGTAFMTVPKNDFYALSGTGYQDGAVQNFNLDRRPVKLGYAPSSTTHQAGTTCVLHIRDEESPSFKSGNPPAENSGEQSSFAVQTGEDFTYEEAKNKRYIIALGIATSATLQVGTYASFIPSPSTEYQIKPSKVFYIVTEYVKVNQPKPQNVEFKYCFMVDFGVRDWDVLLVHDSNGDLRISDDGEASFA